MQSHGSECHDLVLAPDSCSLNGGDGKDTEMNSFTLVFLGS